MNRRLRAIALACSACAALALLAGCASTSGTYAAYPTAFDYPYPEYPQAQTLPRKGDKQQAPGMPMAAPVPVAAAPQATTAGAIYREGGGGLALFQDRKALYPGDLLTITLVERTTATASTSTSTTKDSETELGITSLFGAPVTINGRDLGSTSTSGERAFSGTGNSAQSNRLDGSVTVTVVQRLANGNLVVRGDKLIRLNQSDEIVQIMGIVRAADIGPDNTVSSSRVADVRIAYGGRGAVAKSNVMGWLSRFFQSPLFPM
ncbi:MAG TPA: flagellar basal body L-ring protein FlgH [Arenimonas sp.]|nr:flagellar basal body L-ring protein FlgH [Arenimonas sp.]